MCSPAKQEDRFPDKLRFVISYLEGHSVLAVPRFPARLQLATSDPVSPSRGPGGLEKECLAPWWGSQSQASFDYCRKGAIELVALRADLQTW